MDCLPVKINYISLKTSFSDKTKPDNQLENWFGRIMELAEKEIKENGGFLKLLLMTESPQFLFYNHKIGGILGDFNQPSSIDSIKWFGEESTSEFLNLEDKENLRRVGYLPAGVMSTEEYQKIFSKGALEGICRKFGWPELTRITFAVVDPVGLFCCCNGKIDQSRVHVIPVCRQVGKMRLTPQMPLQRVIMQLIKFGMIPCPSGRKEINDFLNSEFLHGLRGYIVKNGGDQREGEQIVNAHIIKAGEEELKKIKKYFCERDYLRAVIPPYHDTIFQPNKGCWYLYPFAGKKREELEVEMEPWYDISAYNLYARNPCLDLASEVEIAAIDFGTKSTTVAVYDEQGNITLLPVGLWETSNEEKFENPTILKFSDIMQFMKDYQETPCRPSTSFNDILVSHPAWSEYENPSENKNMLGYLSQLKQWVNNPKRKIQICDSKNSTVILDKDGFLDPIEIYAYYIGLYINNMHRGKIYLKYLLSYSSTYLEKSREQIRESFEKGLKKSLPYEIYSDKEIMKEFEVILWRDEATAYAVCAMNRYLEEDAYRKESERKIIRKSRDIQLFYGVYDFGGGTLDFSFGLFLREEKKADRFCQMGYGGASLLGCENILEELAFNIFNGNRKKLIEKGIKCNKPFQYGSLDDERIVSESNQARFNSCGLISLLREYWMDAEDHNSSKYTKTILMQAEDGKLYVVKLVGEERERQNQKEELELKAGKNFIEEYFKRKIEEGIDLFFKKYHEIVNENKDMDAKQCLIFLAGNASRSIRVTTCFQQYLSSHDLENVFMVLSPLPTELDQAMGKENVGGSIPTAKTGVAYGLLLSRPGVDEPEIDDTRIKKVKFMYHIGRRKKSDKHGIKGMFQLLMRAEDVPEEGKAFRKLQRISQEIFELLYTEDQKYALKEDMGIDGNVHVTQIRVEKEEVGKTLYVRANSSYGLELGVSSVDGEMQLYMDRIIGSCDFSSVNRVFKAIEKDKNS